MRKRNDEANEGHSPAVTGVLTVVCIRGSEPTIDISKALLEADSTDVELKGALHFAWFRSAKRALQAVRELVEAFPEKLSAGIATGDIEGDYSRFRMMEEAEGAAGLSEHGQILVTLGTQELVRPSLATDETFVNVGTRLIGVAAAPTRLFMMIAPRLRTDTRPPHSSKIWNPTRFLGRRREIDEIIGLLEGRLVTITGPSGIGKSSLAARIEVEVLDSFVDGSVWIDLATIQRTSLVLHRIAQGLEINTINEPTLFDQIVRRIGDKNYLLIFDAIDHVQETVAQYCELLIERCPNVAVIVTAAKRCTTPSESAYPLLGLEAPSAAEPAEAMLEYDAVRCFVEAARAVDPSFSIDSDNAPAIAGIAEIVDGSPWGLQMAASRISILTPHQILVRLRDEPLEFLGDGGKSVSAIESGMRATLSLLSPTAQCLFARLSVFHGPFCAETIEAVCADEASLPRSAILSSLRELVEVQFVQHFKATRFTRAFYLGTLSRQLAQSLHKGPSQRAIQKRLAAYVDEQVSQLVEHPIKTGTSELERFDLLYEDVRAHWISLLTSKTTAERATDSISACFSYWLQRGYYDEGLDISNMTLAAPGATRSRGYLRVLNLGAWCCIRSGKYRKARLFVREGVRMALAGGSRREQVSFLNTAAALAYEWQRLRTAARCFRWGVLLAEESGDAAPLRTLFSSYSAVLTDLGRFSEAEAMLRRYTELAGSTIEWEDLSLLVNRAHLYLAREDWQNCWRTIEASCDLYKRSPDPSKLFTLYGTGIAAAMGQGHLELSRDLLAAQREIVVHFGYTLTPHQRKIRERNEWALQDAVCTVGSVWSHTDSVGLLQITKNKICNKVL